MKGIEEIGGSFDENGFESGVNVPAEEIKLTPEMQAMIEKQQEEDRQNATKVVNAESNIDTQALRDAIDEAKGSQS